jgi:hypothetical protein
VVGGEQDLVAAKHCDTQLAFALLLKFYGRFGRFPRGRVELHNDAVEFVARQLGVDAGWLGFYEWTGRTIKVGTPARRGDRWPARPARHGQCHNEATTGEQVRANVAAAAWRPEDPEAFGRALNGPPNPG